MHRTRLTLFTLASCFLVGIALIVGAAGCSEEQPEMTAEATLARVDSVLAELGGKSTASLERGRRWRLISSIGAGLPPASFGAEDLPEPEARGAALLEAYCDQCHGIPAPQMHAADEWPLLLRRMDMRARTLRAHMGGRHSSELVGRILLSGMARAERLSDADADSLLAYLQRNALPVAGPDEPTDTPDGHVFEEYCATCHQLPSPDAHTPGEWEVILARMQANMAMMDVAMPSDEDLQRLTRYLADRSGG